MDSTLHVLFKTALQIFSMREMTFDGMRSHSYRNIHEWG